MTVSRGTWGLVILSFAVAVYVVSQKPTGADRSLEEQRTQYLRRIDSLNYAFDRARVKEMALEAKILALKDSLKIQLKTTEKIRGRFESMKRAKVVNLTDAQIDSTLNKLYPR